MTSSLIEVLSKINSSIHGNRTLTEEQNVLNSTTVQALLQNLCVNQVHVKKEDESSGSEEDGLMESKKRKFESERGQEELQNICKIQRMQRNRESAARSRLRKREHTEQLESKIIAMQAELDKASSLRQKLEAENAALRAELDNLKASHIFTSSDTVKLQLTDLSTLPTIESIPSPQSVTEPIPDQIQDNSTTVISSEVPNTPPESPEEAPDSPLTKYATLRDISLQLEEEKGAQIPLSILYGLVAMWFQICLNFFLGTMAEQNEKKINSSTTSSAIFFSRCHQPLLTSSHTFRGSCNLESFKTRDQLLFCELFVPP